jgi:cation transport ATPase
MARSRSPFVGVAPPLNSACACFAVNQFTRRTAGQFFTALMITLFVLVAEVLEGLTVGRGRKAIRDLLEFHPREVSVRRSGEIRAVSAEEPRVSLSFAVRGYSTG